MTLLTGFVCTALAQGPATTEAAVKAGFVFNFGKFTEWPAGALPAGQIQLCLVGQDPQTWWAPPSRGAPCRAA